MSENVEELTNPYDRMKQPKEYQAWYYENIVKPKRQVINKITPKDYFQNKQTYTHQQKKLNRALRQELIETLFVNKDHYHYMRYYKFTRIIDGKKHTYNRTYTEAKRVADEEYFDELNYLSTCPSTHRIFNIVDSIKRHPAFNFVEAWTLFELTWRYTWLQEAMPYRFYPPEITVDQLELFEIVDKRDFMDPVNPITIKDFDKSQIVFNTEILGRDIDEQIALVNKDRAEIRETYLTNGLRALSLLKGDWVEAVNESFTPLIYPNSTRTVLNAIRGYLWDVYDYLDPIEQETLDMMQDKPR